jgi:hypothetical protein
MPRTPDPRARALRQLAWLLGLGLPLALAGFLGSGGFFESYHAQAVSWRPLPKSDGVGDEQLRILLWRADGSTLEKTLPTRAISGLELPREPSALAPARVDESAPVVHRDLFSATVEVTPADGGRRVVSTIRPINGVIPFLALLAVLLGRNLVMTGSVFRLVSDGKVNLPGVKQEPQGVPVQKKARGKKGPPPPRKR